uniref:snRNA-activating protein complex subunit 1-like n=1 Tax=Phallusia mammillata TaxID=59560 RepID=A0A6F9DSK2_9ASCI|nr:snRNA-activating protein complex subunit 1-like [Phallusia mammillata]
MKRKSVVVGTKKVLYPVAGLQSDVEALLQKFVDTNSIRYEDFSKLWRESNFSLVHAGRQGLREKRIFVEEAFKTILKFIQPPFSLQVRVGALYTLYGIYHSQRLNPKVRVRVPLSCWQEVVEMHQEVITHQHLDVDYIIRKMKHEGVFEFVAYPSTLSLEHLYDCDDDNVSSSAVEDNWQTESSALTALLDEESLGQLSAVHDKYHQLKCKLNQLRGGEPNTPSSSLDLIQNDVVETIVRVGQEKDAVLTSPIRAERAQNKRARRSASPDDSARKRASRIREIKNRASSARANTDSSALRYINTSPPTSQDFPSTSSQKRKRAKPTRKPSAKGSAQRNSDSDDSDEVLNVYAISPKKSELPLRTSKRKAQSYLSLAGIHDGSSDGDGMDEISEEDEYNVLADLGNASSSKRRGRASLAGGRSRKLPFSSSDKPAARTSTSAVEDNAMTSSTKEKPGEASVDEKALPKSKVKGKHVTPAKQSKPDKTPKRKSRRRDSTDDGGEAPVSTSSKLEKSVKKEPPTPPLKGVKDNNNDGIGLHQATNIEDSFPDSGRIVESCEPSGSKFKLEVDSFVAIQPTRAHHERPLVAKILSSTATHIEVLRYIGGYSTKWCEPCDDTPHDKETIPKDYVVLGDFYLTPKRKLPMRIMRELRKLYADIDKKV